MFTTRNLLLFAAASMTIATTAPAFAGEQALINANGVDVHVSPNKRAKRVVKLYLGRNVSVEDFSEGWVRISFDVERGVDRIEMDGWLPKQYVRARSRFGFSFEQQAESYQAAYTADDGGFDFEQTVTTEYVGEPEPDVLDELSAEWEAAAEEEEQSAADWTFDFEEELAEDGDEPLPWE